VRIETLNSQHVPSKMATLINLRHGADHYGICIFKVSFIEIAHRHFISVSVVVGLMSVTELIREISLADSESV
jgi:hypothetical protein